MKPPYFSIILLGYQCAPYLDKALSSIRQQTCDDFECLMIVEESTDNSLAICEDMAQQDARFLAIPLPKSGSASAPSNYGIDHAQGRYLVFVDGDDWVEGSLLAEAQAEIERHGGDLDILQYSARVVNEQPDGSLLDGGVISNFDGTDAGRMLTGREAIIRCGRSGAIRNHNVLNICRVQFLRENRLHKNAGLILEDFEWTPRCWYLARRMAFLPRALYCYRRRQNSVMTESSPRVLFDLARQFAHLPAFLSRHQVIPAVRRVWASQWLSLFIWYFFNPIYDRKFSWHDRRAVRDMLMDGDSGETLREFIGMAGWPKRVGMRLLLLSRRLGMWLPRLYFRGVYFPLMKLRDRRQK